jgi:hypothetical protein
MDEDEDEEDKKSGRYKSGGDATAEDGVDSSKEEDDEPTLGVPRYIPTVMNIWLCMLMSKLARKTAAKFMAPSTSRLRAV